MKKNKLILLILAFIFIAPSISAYLFYQHPNWRAQQTVNKGTLIQPSQQLSLFPEAKWHLFLFVSTKCDEACFNRLRQLTQLRLALGRRYYNVDLSLVTLESASALEETQIDFMQKAQIHWIKLSQDNPNTAILLPHGNAVFIATPQQHLILKYTKSTPKDIYQDLKHLLITTDGKNIS